jgi:hypothetical protein
MWFCEGHATQPVTKHEAIPSLTRGSGVRHSNEELVNGIGEFQDQKDRCGAAADRSDTDEKSECAHREWYRKLGLRRPTRSWRLEAPRPPAMMKSGGYEGQPNALIAAPQGEPQFALRMG